MPAPLNLQSGDDVKGYLISQATSSLLALMAERNISKTELAHRLGKSKAFVTQTLSGTRNMTLGTLSAICHELGVEPRLVLAPII